MRGTILWLGHNHTHYSDDEYLSEARIVNCHNSWVEYDPQYISYGYCLSEDQFVWSEDIPRSYWKSEGPEEF